MLTPHSSLASSIQVQVVHPNIESVSRMQLTQSTVVFLAIAPAYDAPVFALSAKRNKQTTWIACMSIQ